MTNSKDKPIRVSPETHALLKIKAAQKETSIKGLIVMMLESFK